MVSILNAINDLWHFQNLRENYNYKITQLKITRSKISPKAIQVSSTSVSKRSVSFV